MNCLEWFSGEASWNMHRIGSYGDPIYKGSKVVGYTPPARRCLSIEELVAKSMTKNARGDWTTGATRDAAAVARLRGLGNEELEDEEEEEEEAADVI